MGIEGRMVVTGGCGFIGTNFVRKACFDFPDLEIIVFDKLTYAGRLENIEDLISCGRVRFVRGDICDFDAVMDAFADAAYIINFAAETHVDRSFTEPYKFVKTNVLGVANILEFVRLARNVRLIHISTDEVYGETKENNPATEEHPLKPTTPYAVTKASADMLCLSYSRLFDLDIVIVRPTNNYGPFQFPEKLIPLFITRAIMNKQLPLYGDGLYIRDWVFVDDLVEAIFFLLEKGKMGEIYNVAGRNRKKNIEIANEVLRLAKRDESLIMFVEDRKIHDRAYFIDDSKIRKLGWKPKTPFSEGLKKTFEFYANRGAWWEKLV